MQEDEMEDMQGLVLAFAHRSGVIDRYYIEMPHANTVELVKSFMELLKLPPESGKLYPLTALKWACDTTTRLMKSVDIRFDRILEGDWETLSDVGARVEHVEVRKNVRDLDGLLGVIETCSAWTWQVYTPGRGGVRVSFDIDDDVDCFPRFWDLLRFCLGSQNRERIFLPAYNDLLADHLESRLPNYQTTWARRWIQCCFAVRTAGLVVQCMSVGLRGAVGAVVVPVAVREAVMKWWYGG